MTDDRNKILNICNKLKKEKLIVSIFEEKDYSINILINEELWTNTAYEVRDRIKGNFERMGYVVKIGGTWWLRITYYDALGIVDNCFNGDVWMTEKRFECDNPLHYRGYGIFDLSKANKTKDDFRDEDGICSYEFHNYLVDETDAMMTGEEVEDLLNKLFDENEQLKNEVYDWKASAEDYLKLGQSLKKENERLKSDNKEYIKGLDLAKATSQSWASDVRELREEKL